MNKSTAKGMGVVLLVPVVLAAVTSIAEPSVSVRKYDTMLNGVPYITEKYCNEGVLQYDIYTHKHQYIGTTPVLSVTNTPKKC